MQWTNSSFKIINVFSTPMFWLTRWQAIMCTEQYMQISRNYMNQKQRIPCINFKGELSKSKFHRSAQDRTPPIINDRINVWPWACTIMWMVDKNFRPLTSPLLWRLSQQSKKYFANLSLASGLPFILILSLTSIKCGELQHTQTKNKNSRWSVPLNVGSLRRSKTS